MFAQDPTKYKVLGQDRGHVSIVDQANNVEWMQLCKSQNHDLWQLKNGNILMSTKHDEISEITPDHKVVWSYQSEKAPGYTGKIEVHAFQPLTDGNVMIAESGNGRLIEVNREGQIVKTIPLTIDKPDAHHDTRMARKLDNSHYLVCHENDGVVREYDATGKVVWFYALDLGGRRAAMGHGPTGHGTAVFGAVRLRNGNTLIAGGNNNRVLEVNPAKEIVWSIDQKELPGITLAWVTTLQVLPNDHIIIGNCHAGPANPQLIEVDRQKKVIWTFNNQTEFGNSLAATQVLGIEGEVIR
jgi:hypothetical protein